MASYNKVVLIGNLTRDPELRYTTNGTAVAPIGLAINRKYTTESGEAREEVTFVDVTAWGKQAETLAQYCRKGHPLMIEGRLKMDQWDDRETGQKRQKLGVVLESFQFLKAKEAGEPAQGGTGPDWDGARAKREADRAAQRPAQDKPNQQSDGPPPDDDDVPF